MPYVRYQNQYAIYITTTTPPTNQATKPGHERFEPHPCSTTAYLQPRIWMLCPEHSHQSRLTSMKRQKLARTIEVCMYDMMVVLLRNWTLLLLVYMCYFDHAADFLLVSGCVTYFGLSVLGCV